MATIDRARVDEWHGGRITTERRLGLISDLRHRHRKAMQHTISLDSVPGIKRKEGRCAQIAFLDRDAACKHIEAQTLKSIQLPPPQTSGGRPLMQALKERQTRREFRPEKLPIQMLSNPLWAAFGINRPGWPAYCAFSDELAGN